MFFTSKKSFKKANYHMCLFLQKYIFSFHQFITKASFEWSVVMFTQRNCFSFASNVARGTVPRTNPSMLSRLIHGVYSTSPILYVSCASWGQAEYYAELSGRMKLKLTGIRLLAWAWWRGFLIPFVERTGCAIYLASGSVPNANWEISRRYCRSSRQLLICGLMGIILNRLSTSCTILA